MMFYSSSLIQKISFQLTWTNFRVKHFQPEKVIPAPSEGYIKPYFQFNFNINFMPVPRILFYFRVCQIFYEFLNYKSTPEIKHWLFMEGAGYFTILNSPVMGFIMFLNVSDCLPSLIDELLTFAGTNSKYTWEQLKMEK